jgi:hypothetical protein
MQKPNALDIARMLIQRDGLRAQAIAMERVAEMRQQGDTAGLDHWQGVHAAIRELRRTAPLAQSRQAAGSPHHGR